VGLANTKALGLNSKNKIKWLIKSLLRFQYSLNLLYSYRMYLLVSMECELQEQLKSSLRKNLSLYSPIGAWLIIALVALAHKELEWPKCLSYEPPLIYDGLMMLSSPLRRSKNCFPFVFNAWKIIFHLLVRSLYLFFLL